MYLLHVSGLFRYLKRLEQVFCEFFILSTVKMLKKLSNVSIAHLIYSLS